MYNKNKNFKLFKGFTLIEILVVITIIALIASIALVSYATLNRNSRDARRRGDLEQVRVALEQYRSVNNAYPTVPAGGFGLPFGTGGLTDPTNTYMSRLPQDPRTPNNYRYTGSASDYSLGSLLENTSACGVAGLDCQTSGGTQACNYCVGPYGPK